MPSDSLLETPVSKVHTKAGDETPAARPSGGKRFAVIVLLCLVLSSVANLGLAHWLGLSRRAPWTHIDAVYRRVGPQTGPQVFCAGSSILVWGLSWPDVSNALGRGIENWTVAGSSPDIWEVFQQQDPNTDTTIVGVSIYDLNEMHLAPERASFVPFATTAQDLWASKTKSELRRRILTQYALSYIRVPYPLAGDSDKVLEGLRSKAAELLGKQADLQEHEGVVVEKAGALEVEDSDTNVSQWPQARALRRLDALRAENHDAQAFDNGPKGRALRRLLQRAQQQGRVIVVVLPVSKYYADTFLDQATRDAFEKALKDDMTAAPKATLVRLDQVPGIWDNKNFFDLVHMNLSGRRLATAELLKEIQ